MKQKIRKVFNVFVMLSMLLGMVIAPALAAGGAGTQSASASPVTQEDATAKIDPQVLLEIQESGETEFFVWMKEKADLSPAANLKTKLEKGQFVFDTLRATAERTQRDLRASLDAQGVEYQPFYIANKVFVRSGGEVLALDLAARSDVAQITPNRQFQLQEPFKNTDVPRSPAAVEPNISYINADDVWAMGITGQGTVMAGNDTGLDWDHSALITHYRGWDGAVANHNYSWWDATGTYPNVPGDGHGHGTHTTGTMVGDDGGTNQIGVAPGAQTVHCKNMTDGGSGSDLTFSTCFQWDLAPWDLTGATPLPSMAPDAVNNSWGYGGGGANQFEDEIAALQAAGIVVEVSAGNEGSSCSTLRSPGDYAQVLTTGSVNHASPFPGSLSGFSSRGPSSLYPGDYMPDVMAPGENIRSSLPGDTYDSWGGTSMAGPHVTALVGLMWAANPALKGQVDLTYQTIHETAVPLTGVPGSNCGGDYTVGPNNDWGFGTIDALAAVEAAIALGGVGFLQGTVTDSSTTAPLADVSIAATLSPTQTFNTTTDALGVYGRYLSEGTYDVTASKFGYIPETVTGLSITDGVTVTEDFALDPAPSATLNGYVKDANTGWPLYASIEIAGYPDNPVWNDPVTGYYEVILPEGSTYGMHVEAWVSGYLPADASVGPLMSDTAQDFLLDVEPIACAAPGYEHEQVFLEDFESGFGNWTLSGLWNSETETDTCGSLVAPFPSPQTGAYYGQDGVCTYDNGATNSGSLTTVNPVALPSGDLLFGFDSFEETECGGDCSFDNRYVDISTDSGATWTTLGEGNVENAWHRRVFDISAYAGQNALFRFRFSTEDSIGNGYFGWMVDDVGVLGTCEPPADSGLVVGNVYDGNTLDSLTGATVENQAGFSFTTQATADLAVEDGFYTLFSPAGAEVFTATFTTKYGSDVKSVLVVDGSTAAQDFLLPAPFVSVEPTSFSVDVPQGYTLTENLVLSNTGAMATSYEFSERDLGFDPAMENTGTITWLKHPDNAQAVSGSDSGQTVAYPGAYRYTPAKPVLDANILMYVDEWYHIHPNTYPEQAVLRLGLPAEVYFDGDYTGFETALNTGGPWDLVIWQGENYNIDPWPTLLNSLLTYVEGGGKLAGTYWAQLYYPTDPLWAAMGFEYEANDTVAPPAYWWEPGHNIFNNPEQAPEWLTRFARSGTSQGTYLEPLANGQAMSGYTTTPAEDQANIVIGNDGQTVYKGIRDLSTDADDDLDGIPDAVELWENIISGLLEGFGGDVPWLSETPITGTLEADSVVDIDVSFDSMTYTLGTYSALLKVKTDAPVNPTIDIPVTMNVVAVEYGVDAFLENDSLSGMPGETVTYNVNVTNTGNVPDVFDVVVSGNAWATNALASLALEAGESAAVEVTVEIPAGAANGDQDAATCTFTSQGDPTKSDSAAMTTTAELPYEFGVDLAPASDAKASAPGSIVAYTLQLTNTGDVTDTFDLAVGSVEGWLVDFSAIEFTLGAGDTAEVTVHVTVPADAAEGAGDVTTVTATSQGDDSVSAASDLTTTTVFPKIFLPVIPQGFETP